MERIENDIAYLKSVTELVNKEFGLTGNEAVIKVLDHMTVAFYNGLDGIDALDYAIICLLEKRIWHKQFTVKVAHDLYHCPYYEETAEAADLWLSDSKIAANAPYSLVEKIFDLYYKNWGEDTEAFLWRCLCLGCLPSEEWLLKSEEEKRSTFTADMGWVAFRHLFELSEEEIEQAYDALAFHIDFDSVGEATLKVQEEARNG